MSARRLLVTVVLVLGIAAGVAAGAGATATSGFRADVSTRAGAAAYLRAIGLRPERFAIQIGERNYAGPKCPGQGWRCTTATRVLQIATSPTGSNVSVCTDADCAVVQVATTGGNTFRCDQQSSSATASQSCVVVQKRADKSKAVNKNSVTVTQLISQSGSAGSQGATQVVKITQSNDAGPNELTISQTIDQRLDSPAASVTQRQTANQLFHVAQCAEAQVAADAAGNPGCATGTAPLMSGATAADVAQTVKQTASAAAATAGSQAQEANLEGHVDQWTTSNARSAVSQTEAQDVSALSSGVLQTQIGPMRIAPTRARAAKNGRHLLRLICCSNQGTNPSNTFTIDQSSSQRAATARGTFALRDSRQESNNPLAHSREEQIATCETSGTCTKTQNGTVVTGNGQTQNFCSNGVCSDGRNLPTAVAYTGATSALPNAPVTLAALLTRAGDGAPLAGQDVVLGVAGTGLGCTARTGVAGAASCSLILGLTPGTYTLVAEFAGAGPYEAASATAQLVIPRRTATVAYAGPRAFAAGASTPVSATLRDGAAAASPFPAPATVTFTLAAGGTTASCTGTSASGDTVRCSLPVPAAFPLGPATLTTSFSGAAGFEAATDVDDALVYALLGRGAFAVGAAEAAIGSPVTFWSPQWPQLNPLQPAAPSSFAGFADTFSPAPPACGGTWTSGGGNSPPPPASVPSYMGVVGTTSVAKSGSGIRGDVRTIVVVATDPGYSVGPGGRGTGTVVARVC